MNRVVPQRSRTAHHVSLDVPAGSECGQPSPIDLTNGLLQVVLDDSVQLQSLPTGDPQRPVAKPLAQIQVSQERVGGHPPTGDPRPNHEHERLVTTRAVLVRQLACIPVVLLVQPVVLQQAGVVFVEVVELVFGRR